MKRKGMPVGLCGNKSPHGPHEHRSDSLGLFWCTANQHDREPERSRRRWQA